MHRSIQNTHDLKRLTRYLLATLFLLFTTASLQATEPSKPGPWDPKGIKPFEFVDQSGKTIRNDDLKGKPWIVGFVFTRCQGPCPTVSRKMKELRDLTGVQTVTMTVDPDFDTPEVLARYEKNFLGVKENPLSPWHFLHGEKDKVYRLIKESFLLPVQEMQGASRRPGWEVLHSTEILLVNSENQVVAKFNATKDEEVIRLRRILDGKDPFPPPPEGPRAQPGESIQTPDGSVLRIVRTDEPSNSEKTESTPAPDLEKTGPPAWTLKLPAVNASLNGLAAVMLMIGYLLIKQGQRNAHRNVMLAAFGVSVLFLACYLVYHYHVPSKRFEGPWGMKLVYYPILISHVLLAMSVPFLAGTTIYRGLKQDWARHRSIARVTYPIWIYVSVTGVIIYLMLYQRIGPSELIGQ